MLYSMNKKKGKTKMGRPPKPPNEKRGDVLSVRVTADERKRLEKDAARIGTSLGELLMRPWREKK